MPSDRPHDLSSRSQGTLPSRITEGDAAMAEDSTRKRLLAIDVLLEEPEEISDGLETELYALRDKLHVIALGGS
jgi:hypothetical protein